MIHQTAYIQQLIQKLKQESCKRREIPLQPNINLTRDLENETDQLRKPMKDPNKYRMIIGSLIYLMINTRPDIAFSVTLLSRFIQEPKEKHWRCLKNLLRYVITTKNYALVYKKSNEEIKLVGYTDADFAGSIDDRKSTSGYLFKYGDCLISWNSAKQKIASLSSTEAEYIALTLAIVEAIWLKQLLLELNRETEVTVYCDNKSTICLAENPEFHSRTKHIDIRYHFIRECV